MYLRMLLGHRGMVLSEDGVLLASRREVRTARVWDIANGNLLHTLGMHDGDIVAFSEDYEHLTTRNHRDFPVEAKVRRVIRATRTRYLGRAGPSWS